MHVIERSVGGLNLKVRRYHQLKQQQKEIEQELGTLRNEIIAHCTEQGVTDQIIGNYQIKLVSQERKEFDDQKLFAALPDHDVWRMISRADPSKINSMIKLNVISDETIKDTYSVKSVTLLQVEKL
jgi:hypothetical protein